MKPIVRVEGLSKSYQLGARESHDTLRDSLMSVLRSPLRGGGRGGETLWALREVSFEVAPGEVVGVVGRNGAGKSTLLKILSRITEPTSGRVELYGRIGSLLEVGTGFHPELTGRENIFLNGAILGMRRREIAAKFDEIVAFAEVERFIDTPVKRYSSGKYMRLAFAVAAHLEPEILLVDEVLAVGDAQFQQKCLGKMGEVAREGRTVLFVSHNMTAVNQLCTRAVLLSGGRLALEGRTQDVVAEYFRAGSDGGGERVWPDPKGAPGNERMRLRAVRLVSGGRVNNEPDIDKELSVEVEFWNFLPGARHQCVNIYLFDAAGNVVLSTANTTAANAVDDEWFRQRHEPGLYRSVCTFPANFLNEGTYYVTVYLATLGPISMEAAAHQVLSFNVFDTGVMREAGIAGRWDGVVRVRLPWRTEAVAAPEALTEAPPAAALAAGGEGGGAAA